VSVAALACARANAAALSLAGRASFVACSYGSALKGPVDVLVCNPPYVASADLPALEPEVREYDPRRALDGGRDGLDGYRAIAAEARGLLTANGRLVLELGAGQADAVIALMSSAGLAPILPPQPDLAGVARALVLRPAP
jgi:release factor glutamine methyltransferase